MADQEQYVAQYGFGMNDYEINYYKAHYAIWQQFVNNTADDYCLVCESAVSFNVAEQEFGNLGDSLPGDWEIFFPFDRFGEHNKQTAPEICIARLGYFVGCPAYFISRKGAEKMLTRSIITQPLDEELLSLSLSDQLTADFSETGWFSYDHHASPSFIARKTALSDAIFSIPGWNSQHRAIARRIIRRLVHCCKQLDIDLVLHAGSLIGGIRHGGIMPWDDDIDFAIHHRQVHRLIAFLEKENVLAIKPVIFRRTGSVYYKCWMKEEGEITEGFEHRFPFVDLWLFYDKEEEGYVVHKEGHRYPIDICMPFRTMYFEGSEVQIPNDPLATLDLQYPGWREYIEVYAWCHRLKKPLFKKLRLRIRVNEAGAFIPDEPVLETIK
jgi:hypothetical protein